MTQDNTTPFEAALADILAPLARAMVGHGVTIAQVTEMLKHALLKAAEEAAGDGTRPTDSRISAMTGLHRKDVKRLRDTEAPPPKRETSGPAALIVGYWMAAPAFQASDGAPRVLARRGEGDVPGFDDLVRQSRVDLPPSTLLDLLLEEGVVAETPDGYALARPGLIGRPASATQASAFARNLSAHLQTAVENLLAETPPHFERALHVNKLTPASVATLQARAGQAAAALLADLNREALRLQEADADGAGAEARFSLGAYIHASPGATEET